MDRDQILARLRAYEPELRSTGVAALSLFGSVARGEAGQDSDLDVAVRLAEPRATGLAWFRRMEALRKRLEAISGRPVDLVSEPVRAPGLRAAIEQDRLVAFQ